MSAILDQIYPPEENIIDYGPGRFQNERAGQAFTGNGGKITEARFYCFSTEFTFADLSAEIYAHTGTYGTNGKPTGLPLATSNGAYFESDFNFQGKWVNFTFSGSNQLQTMPNQHYFIVLKTGYVAGYTGLHIGFTDQTQFFNGGTYVEYNTTGYNTWDLVSDGSNRRIAFQILGNPPTSCTLTYNGNEHTNGSAPIDSSSPYISGSIVTVLGQNTIAKSGNIFLGWATTNNAPLAQYAQDSKFTILDNTVLYAIWGPPSTPLYTVTYNGNGSTAGNIPQNSIQYSQGVSVPVAANPGGLVKTGHIFLGWAPNSTVSVPTFIVNGDTVNSPSFNMGTANVVLYAIWEQIQYYTVTYTGDNNANGVPPVDSTMYVSGSTVTVLGRGTLSRLHYTFLGWFNEAHCAFYGEDNTFTITENIVMYPVWDQVPPSTILQPITYNGNGHTTGSPPMDVNAFYPTGVTVTVLGQGTLKKTNHVFLGWHTSKTASTPKYVQWNTFGMPPNGVVLYAVWRSGAGSTIVVPYNGRYAGAGSKQTIITFNGASTIMCVASNQPNDLDSNAVIENLIIDGSDSNGNFGHNTTGILLENVCNCLIRNLTIRNCDVGIEVKITDNNKAFGNRFEHIRMINVKTGILFTGTSSNKDFAYTTIDNVCTSLVGIQDSIGIKIASNANLYNAFIKGTVWTSDAGHKCLEVSGALKYSLVNLEVENAGTGVKINSGAVVSDNQHFLLATLGLDLSKSIVSSVPSNDITLFAQLPPP